MRKESIMLKKVLILTSIAIGIAGLFNTECEASSSKKRARTRTCSCVCVDEIIKKRKKEPVRTDAEFPMESYEDCDDYLCDSRCKANGKKSGYKD
jgi:hypothetical protein